MRLRSEAGPRAVEPPKPLPYPALEELRQRTLGQYEAMLEAMLVEVGEVLDQAAGGPDVDKGGPYIGPRGGKWADAQLTISWKEREPTPVHAPAAAEPKGRHPDHDLSTPDLKAKALGITESLLPQLNRALAAVSMRPVHLTDLSALRAARARWYDAGEPGGFKLGQALSEVIRLVRGTEDLRSRQDLVHGGFSLKQWNRIYKEASMAVRDAAGPEPAPEPAAAPAAEPRWFRPEMAEERRVVEAAGIRTEVKANGVMRMIAADKEAKGLPAHGWEMLELHPDPEKIGAIKLRDLQIGGTTIVHRSTKREGMWQASRMDKEGVPYSDSQYRTLTEALREERLSAAVVVEVLGR